MPFADGAGLQASEAIGVLDATGHVHLDLRTVAVAATGGTL